jgi:hypothetical protein
VERPGKITLINRMKRRNLRWLLLGALALIALAVLAGTARLWTGIRSRSAATNQTLFQGVTYTREIRGEPRRMVIHVVTVDLRVPGIVFLVTPGDPKADLPLKARTTSQFLDEFGVQIAVNGDGVTPWRSNGLLDYYPHTGDPVDPIGLAASNGVTYSDDTDAEPTLYISRANQAKFNSPIGKVYNAISGNVMLVEQGKSLYSQPDQLAQPKSEKRGNQPTAEPPQNASETPQPRTAVALDRRSQKLIIVVVDGRQPGFSEGATLAELADILIAHGGFTGMNLDGGGSSTLVIEKNGKPAVLNSPIDNQIPGRERPVGNHLGIFVRPVSKGK